MLVWIGIAFLAAAGFAVLRWIPTRLDALGRPRAFPWVTVVALLALGSVALAPFALRARLEHRLAQAATAIVGADVEVRCQSFGGAFADAGADLGYVAFGRDGTPERSTLIKRDQCGDLSDYLSSDKLAPTHDQVVAVHVLTHEAIHMSGVRDEAQTECIAVQRDTEMARLLGAPPGAARALAVSYWRNVYPFMPANYRSDQCGPGLDLDTGGPHAPWLIAGAKD